MKALEYTAQDKEKHRAIDAQSILDDMDDLERFNGATNERIVDNYYEIKRRVLETVVTEAPKDEPKKKL